MNSRYISYWLLFVTIFSSCAKKKDVKDPYQMRPPYKLINLFSQKIQSQTDLILTGYAYNWCLPKDYPKKGIGNFSASYSLEKSQLDEISLDSARNLIVFLGENLLKEINANSEVRPDLDVYPFGSDRIRITVHFKDENQIDLGQGVAIIYLRNGRVEYEGYKIREYTSKYPAKGKHFTIYEESYEEALEIVKNQGSLTYL